MNIDILKKLKLFLILFFLLVFVYFFYIFLNKFQENFFLTKASEPIIINLLTSVHPNLPWRFQTPKKKIIAKPGEIITIEYLVENLDNNITSGIATFAYFPNEFGQYISKLNCFCYDAQTLKPKEKDKYVVVMLIDPEVTKDTKTKDIKEVTIQFTFFDYKEYKESES